MDLIGFVVAGENMHHKIDPETVRQFALSFACKTPPDGQQRATVCIHGPRRSPIVATNHNRGYPVVEVAKGDTFDLFCVCWCGFDPDGSTGVTTGKVLEQVEGTGQDMIVWQRL